MQCKVFLKNVHRTRTDTLKSIFGTSKQREKQIRCKKLQQNTDLYYNAYT